MVPSASRPSAVSPAVQPVQCSISLVSERYELDLQLGPASPLVQGLDVLEDVFELVTA